MRAGGCTIQQALTAEAATVVKQAVTLARRRGHAQVTPLHVANTMLASSTGLLRTACLQSHSHPLQCKALELCFNVALHRLPASTSATMLATHSQQFPSISNALVAAFKRAQAHQRRGSIENQQQPLLAVKIELEQLIISILDDPSVSRVMREAGFSSTQVKSNVEQAVSLEICSQPNNSSSLTITKSKESSNLLALSSHPSSPLNSQSCSKTIPTTLDPIRNEDVLSVVESLVTKRKKNFVVVGECISSIEGVVNGVINKIIKGDVPDFLREVKILPFHIASFGQLSRVEVDQKLEELKRVVRNYISKGVILNLGDLKWIIEIRSMSSSFLCPIEHIIMEIGKLGCGISENNGKFWIMGIATFQTYMKCKSNYPSLETIWNLHPLTIPAGSLRLSLITDSESTSKKADENGSNWIIIEGEEEKKLSCCPDCKAKFENEARSLQISSTSNSESTTTSTLPAWLQQYKNENTSLNTNDQDFVSMKDLRKKWNTFCNSIHQPERTITFSSSTTSAFSYDHQYTDLHHSHHLDFPIVKNPNPRDRLFEKSSEPSLRIYIPEHTPNSTSTSDLMEMEDNQNNFKEFNADNLKSICNALQMKVPWQKHIISEIATTILQCRSGMIKRKRESPKQETWLFFQGVDMEAKEIIAKELAKLVFGSQNNLVSIALSSFSSSTRTADSTEDMRNKRLRDEHSFSYVQRFVQALSKNPHRVFFIEDVEQADYCSQMGFKRAIERGKVSAENGDEIGLCDAIIILSCESFSSRSRACSPPVNKKADGSQEEAEEEEEEEEKGCITMEDTSPSIISLDLNISIDDDSNNEEDECKDDIGLLESVDRRIIFKIQEL